MSQPKVPPKGEVGTWDSGVTLISHGFEFRVLVRVLEREGMDEAEALEWVFWHVAARLRETGADPKEVLEGMPDDMEWSPEEEED